MTPRGRACHAGPLALLVVLLLAPVGAAHAEIESSEPPDGVRLDAAPEQVRLRLTQPVEPSNVVLTVTDQEGRRVDAGDVQISGGQRPVVTVSLQPGTGDGAYLVSLTATSLEDGHRITYTRSFAVGGFAPLDTGDPSDDVDAAGAAARATSYAGLALVLGALVLGSRLGWPAGLVSPARLGAAANLVGSGWLLWLSQAAAAQSWEAFARTDVGTVLVTRAALAGVLLLAALAMPPRNATRAAATAGLLALAIIATARFTHASGRGPGAIANDALHIVAAGAWVGGLILLLWLWREPGRDAVADARAFSTPALLAVIGIAATGVLASLLILPRALWGDPTALLVSPYGAFLAGKVAIALAMVAVAAVNRYVLLSTPGESSMAWLRNLAARTRIGWLQPAAAPAVRGLRRLVGAEALGGLLVLVLAGLLLSTSPPKDIQASDVLRVTGEGDEFLATAIIEPAPAVGANSSLHFMIQYTPDHFYKPGQAVTNNTCGGEDCVTLTITSGNGTVNQVLVATPAAGGWVVESIIWPRAGAYDLVLRVSTDVAYQDEVAFRINVGS